MAENKDKKSLEEFKEEYKKLQKKHGLPSFEDLNKDFYIEKLAEVETDYLIREVRRMVAERIFNSLRMIETFLNPSNAPMFVFSMVKTFTDNEKKALTEIYKELARNEVELIKLDLGYSEEKEAEFIKNSCKIWKKAGKELLEVIKIVEKNWDNKTETNGKGYFG